MATKYFFFFLFERIWQQNTNKARSAVTKEMLREGMGQQGRQIFFFFFFLFF
jgi:hypothetical protein